MPRACRSCQRTPRDLERRGAKGSQLVLKPFAGVEVVINCANVGTVYSESRRQLYAKTLLGDTGADPAPNKSSGAKRHDFPWEVIHQETLRAVYVDTVWYIAGVA